MSVDSSNLLNKFLERHFPNNPLGFHLQRFSRKPVFHVLTPRTPRISSVIDQF